MSEDTATKNLPIKWDEEMARHAKEVAELERPPLSKISLQSGVMQYQGMVVPDNKLECIILALAFERRYDTKPFDAMNIQPPDCFALSVDGEAMTPYGEIVEPQHENCDECPRNKWVPNPRKPGKNHKPCKERRRLVLLPKSAIQTQGAVKGAEMAILTVPVMSVRNWGAYVNLLLAEFRRPPWGMVTEISVSPDTKSQFAVKFRAINTIPDDYLGDIHGRIPGATEAAMSPWDVIPLVAQKNEAPTEVPSNRKY